jgi:predicted membrane chloride channel (bestrophin family)
LGYVFSLGYLAIPVVMFVFYILASLEVIAEEIEEPFGTDTNDLPMERLSEMIKKKCRRDTSLISTKDIIKAIRNQKLAGTYLCTMKQFNVPLVLS